MWPFLKSVGPEIFENLLSSWRPFFKSIEVYILKSKIFPFLKQSLALFSYKHLASLTLSYHFPHANAQEEKHQKERGN